MNSEASDYESALLEAGELRAAISNAEMNLNRVIDRLNEQSSFKQADSVECAALSQECARLLRRWNKTSAIAVTGFSAIEQAIIEEKRKQELTEKALRAKEEKLARLWTDSKVIKTAIGILENNGSYEFDESQGK